MNAEIIAVGTELLLGDILNTNAQYLSQQLAAYGVDVYGECVVGDHPSRLREAVKLALSRADWVFLTGGLGPTADDLTRETVAELWGRKLVFDETIWQKIADYFKTRKRTPVESNRRQAMVPEGAAVLKNRCGTAPGLHLEQDGHHIILLPGPPHEMRDMFEHEVVPLLEKATGCVLRSRVLRVFGMGESEAAECAGDLMDGQNPTLAPYAKDNEMIFRITAKAETAEQAEAMMNPIETELRNRIGDVVYATGETDLQTVVVEKLLQKGLSVATAESCTAGGLAEAITDVSGASDIFRTGIVAYHNETKEQLLGVPHELLETHGAVSPEVARAMAEGIARVAGADIGIGITGIAGPTGGSPEKPVGLVYIGVWYKNQVKAFEFRFAGTRAQNRKSAVRNALNLIRKTVDEQMFL
ncbi:MAG: competence/damage-inducible protein A [Clostridia bacterium]|nr:competence/damage-inducible protein A [Clostridia bacterium]